MQSAEGQVGRVLGCEYIRLGRGRKVNKVSKNKYIVKEHNLNFVVF